MWEMSLQVQAFLETVLKSEWEPTASCKCHSGFNASHRQSAFNSRRAAERFHFHFSCLIFFLHETGAELIWALVSFDRWEFCLTRVLSWEVTTPLCSVENARTAIHKHGDPRRPSPLPPPARSSVWLAFSLQQMRPELFEGALTPTDWIVYAQ